MLLLSLALGICSIIVCCSPWAGLAPGFWYIFVSDCNTFLAVCISICAFMFFKNLNIGYSRFINTVASTTFGIFLIHTNDSGLVQWLWVDTLKNKEMYASSWMPLHVLLSVLGVFTVCSLIDLARIHLVERPFFRLWDKLWPKLYNSVMKLWNEFCGKLKIGN